MTRLTCIVLLTFASTLLAPAVYGQPAATEVLSLQATAPRFPTPLQMAVIGLSLTAVAVVGARATNRTTDMMMYMVLGCLAVTAVMTAYSDRLHSEFVRAGFERLEHLRQQLAVAQRG